MVNKLETQWLEEALKSVEVSDNYIDDNGFSTGVMEAIAQEETARFLRWRKIIVSVVGLLLAFGLFSIMSGHSVAEAIAEPLTRYDWTTIVPVGAIFSLLVSFGCTAALKE
ncbi:MAG: hypothetical protein HWD83_06065 [Gammaproteobacteria bacterium]|nr:hypothetical protein [Gammaproteobacteria bacterium]